MSAKSSLLTVSQDELNWVRQNSIFKAMEDRNASMHNGMKKARAQGLQEGREEGMKQGLEQGLEAGRKLGMKQGMKQGECNAKIEMARNLLTVKLGTVEQISQVSGLSLEQVLALKEEVEAMQEKYFGMRNVYF